VTAVTLRGDLLVQTGRRSGDGGPTIGSHTPPKTALFIGDGALNCNMQDFHVIITQLTLPGV
jgi:hypothetical protein